MVLSSAATADEARERDLAHVELRGADQERQAEEQELLLQRLTDEVDDEVADAPPAPFEPPPDPRLEQQPEPPEQREQRDDPRDLLAALHEQEPHPTGREAERRQQPRHSGARCRRGDEAARSRRSPRREVTRPLRPHAGRWAGRPRSRNGTPNTS